MAGYRRWRKLSRRVRTGASGIFIWARVMGRVEDAPGNKVETLLGFRPSAVFADEDLEDFETRPYQVSGRRCLTAGNPSFGRCGLRWMRPASRLSRDMLDAEGMTDGVTIMARKGLGSRNRLGIFILERAQTVGHVGLNRDDKPWRQRELEADASALIVMHHLGLDNAGGWDYLCHRKATPDDLIVSLDAINRIVKQIGTAIEQA